MVKYDFSAKSVLHKGPKPTQMRAKIDFFEPQIPSAPDMKISAQFVDALSNGTTAASKQKALGLTQQRLSVRMSQPTVVNSCDMRTDSSSGVSLSLNRH